MRFSGYADFTDGETEARDVMFFFCCFFFFHERPGAEV